MLLINRLEETSDKLDKLADAVHAPRLSLLTMLRVQTGIHEGLDEKGSAAIVVLPPANAAAPPQLVVLLPVTDYKRFLAQLQPADPSQRLAEVRLAGTPVVIAQHGEFAAVAPSGGKTAIDEVLNSVKDAGTELAPLKAWLDEVNAVAVATPAGIKYAVEQAPGYLIQLRGLIQLSAPQQPALSESVKNLEPWIKTFGAEVTHAALGIKCDESSNLRIAVRTRFTSGGDWSNAAKGMKAPKEGVLAGLPADPFGLACGLMMPDWLRQLTTGGLPEMIKQTPILSTAPPDLQAQLAQAGSGLVAPLDSVGLTLGIPKSGEPMFASFGGVIRVADAPKYLDDYATAVNRLAAALKPAQNPAPPYAAQKIDLEGTPAVEVTTDWTALNPPPTPDLKPVLERMFGPGDKGRFYLAAIDDKTLVLAYVGTEQLKRAIAAAKSPAGGLAGDPLVAETLALVPKQSQWLMLLQPSAMNDFSPAPAGPGQPPAAAPAATAPTAPPFGLAARITAAGLNIDIAAPAATLRGG